MRKLYSAKELKQFDKLTNDMSSLDQLKRINARLRVNSFIAEHGKDKCDAMFAELTKRDRDAE